VILGWTVLRPSARERWLRNAARVAAGATAVGLSGAALLADPRDPVPLWLAVLTAWLLLAWSVAGRSGEPGGELAIDDDGVVLYRPSAGGNEAPVAARGVFVDQWLITLRVGAMWVPVWPDALPADAFRRLQACVRWSAPITAPDSQRPPTDGALPRT
jgi:hypothetical protein